MAESALFPLLAAIGSGLAFASLQILFKRQLSATSSPLVLPSWLGLLFPLWCTVFIITHATGALTFNLSLQSLIWPAGWAICTVTTTTALVWLLRNYSLSELVGYKKALVTFGAAIADIFIFKQSFPWLTSLSILLLLAAAIGLSHSRSRLPTRPELAVIAAWCLVMILQISLYKQGLKLQPEILAHTILAQAIATLGYSLLWFLPRVSAQPQPSLRCVTPVLLCALTGVILEGFAYASLPLALVLVITMLPAAVMTMHDLYRGDLPRTSYTVLALAALFLGFSLLFF